MVALTHCYLPDFTERLTFLVARLSHRALHLHHFLV